MFFLRIARKNGHPKSAVIIPTGIGSALVIVFSVAGMALTKLPEFEAWKNRVFGKRKEGAA